MDTLLQDVRYAFRRLMRSRGFAMAAILTLALGIGANTAIFSVVNGVVLRPLPFGSPDRLVEIATIAPSGAFGTSSALDYTDWRTELRSFSGMAIVARHSFTYTTPEADPERVHIGWVGTDFFSVLQVPGIRGRTFTAAEGEEGNHRVVVLAEWFWRQRLGSDDGVVGKAVTLNDRTYEVIGVAPASLNYPANVAMWRPMVFDADDLAARARGARWLTVVGRLAPGATLASANAELARLGQRFAAEYTETNVNQTFQARPLSELIVGNVRTPLLVLLGAVCFVTLIACANVANLMLARAAAREGEFAIRAALGAGRGRVVRQLVTESVILAMVGGFAALMLAWWGVDLFTRFAPSGLPRAEEIAIDAPVLIFTMIIALATGLLFGLAPALQAGRGELSKPLREGARGFNSSPASHRLRSALVVTEVAMAVLLLVGAGLLLRSFGALQNVDPGFRAEGVLTFELALPGSRYAEDQAQVAFVNQLHERLRQAPGVVSAGGSFMMPMDGSSYALSFTIDGEPVEPGSVPSALITSVTPDYIETMGMRVLRGRSITPDDHASAPGVVLVNETLANSYFAGRDPVGQRIQVSSVTGDPIPVEIVGVVSDVRQEALAVEPQAELYHAYSQRPFSYISMVARTAGDPNMLIPMAREALRALDPSLPMVNPRPLTEAVGDTVATSRLYMYLLGIFAAVALALASVGIYGVMSYNVTLRTREVGVRVALGATPGSVLRMVVRQGLALAAIGVGVGVLAAYWLTRLLASLLYGIGATDVATFAGVVVVLLTVALLACWIPARRASRVDPVLAMRSAE